MFRKKHPVAWAYHQHTCRWPHNMHGLYPVTYEVPYFKEDLDVDALDLPEITLPQRALGDVLVARQSCRRFLPEPLQLVDLATLLFAGYGISGTTEMDGEFFERPVPSGGGLYPLELYVVVQTVNDLERGVWHYVPPGHRLEPVHPERLPRMMTAEMFMGQPYLINAAAVIIITAMVERSLWKYEDRGYRYILMEAGHVAQNINLCATAMDIGSLNLGGFFDEDIGGLLRLDLEEEVPVYGIAVGHPEALDRAALRTPDQKAAIFRRY